MMTCFRTSPFNSNALAGWHEGTIAPFLEIGEEAGHRDMERFGKRSKRRKGRGCAAIFYFGQHTRRESGLRGEVCCRELETLA